MIELEGVGYRIGKNWLVRDINITIEKGMLWGFVGPNGAGKSTLLRLISGELLPTTGEIRLLGKPIHSYAPPKVGTPPSLPPTKTGYKLPISPAWRSYYLGDIHTSTAQKKLPRTS